MLKRWIITLTFIPCVIPAGTTSAQSWSDLELDTAFGTDGLATRAFDLGQDNRDVGNAVVRVPGTGQLFTVGAIIAVSGLTADGLDDPSFGEFGRVILDIEVVEDGVDTGRDITVIPWPADETWRLVVVGAGRSTSSINNLDFSATRVSINDVVFFDGFESSGWWGADWSVTVGESP